MNDRISRVLTLTVVLLVVFTLSGIASSAALLKAVDTPAACCNHTGSDSDDSEPASPCPAPACSCCSVINLLHSEALRLVSGTYGQVLPTDHTDSLHLSSSLHDIEYPPENVRACKS